MDLTTALGLAAGAAVVVTLILLGGDLRTFYDVHAIIVIFGGSFAATLIRFPLASILHGVPLGIKYAFTMRRMTQDRKSTRLNSSHIQKSRMPSSA